MFYFIINLERQKLKLSKAKLNFCNADADADISERSRETTVRTKKKVLFPEIGPVKLFYYLPARKVECVTEYLFFV